MSKHSVPNVTFCKAIVGSLSDLFVHDKGHLLHEYSRLHMNVVVIKFHSLQDMPV